MPLPFIIAGAAISGAYGIYKAGSAWVDSDNADELNADARRIVQNAQRKLDDTRKESNCRLGEFGQKKLDAVTITLKRFVDSYIQLKNVELLVDGDMDKLGLADFDDAALQEIRNDISLLESSAVGLGSGAAGGALVAFGAYNGTMMLGAAGTGTAISALSGAAATNATLAWLGGGSLATGGFGMAGGMMVLGGLVAGPALAIFGHVLGNGAAEKLSDAQSNKSSAWKFDAECSAVGTKLEGISRVAALATDTLSSCRSASRRASKAMAEVIERSGTDYREFSTEDQEKVFKAVKLAQLVKAVVDTPILDKDGNLLGDSEANLRRFKTAVVMAPAAA